MSEKRNNLLVNEVWNAILNDGWMWLVDWGPNRNGKTTCAMQVAFQVYKDWDKVLDCIVFTLSQFFHKIRSGRPECYSGKVGFNKRVPLLIWDDMAVHLNKAVTQHNIAVDTFKGYFQAVATDLAVLIGTMLVPTGITLQLHEIYTHEIHIPTRGVYKFDKARWQQNFRGWDTRPNKEWLESAPFFQVPSDVYKEYNLMRLELTSEAKIKIMDQLVEEVPYIIKRLKTRDFELLETIQNRGPLKYSSIQWRFKDGVSDMLARLKARDLIIPMRKGQMYEYEISDLGLEVLRAKNQTETFQPVQSPHKIH